MPEICTVHVMALDDDLFILRVLSLLLEKLGISRVTTCDNGNNALALLDNPETMPNLIFLDLNMPEMDGVEFLRHLVQRAYSGSVVLMSGESDRVLHTVEKLAIAHEISILGVMKKPFSLEDLSTLLARWTTVAPHAILAPKKLYSEGELRDAIDNCQLINYYQPKIDVGTGTVVGVETLVRWLHPVDGLVFPEQFIHVAEQHGLIDELTRIVLDNALAQLSRWKSEGLALHMAVNLSMKNLTSPDFADSISAKVAEAGLLPQEIVLEVTESQLMQDIRAPLETLTRLRLKQFGLSIDDFGTGHSSLTQLRDIPFNELKIDRSFTHGAWADATLRAIYDASLSLARQLDMNVVAEGVEDQEDWDLLSQTGCAVAQGHYIAEPMPGADLSSWIASWSARVRSEGFAAS